jgi:hypothetical protein
MDLLSSPDKENAQHEIIRRMSCHELAEAVWPPPADFTGSRTDRQSTPAASDYSFRRAEFS